MDQRSSLILTVAACLSPRAQPQPLGKRLAHRGRRSLLVRLRRQREHLARDTRRAGEAALAGSLDVSLVGLPQADHTHPEATGIWHCSSPATTSSLTHVFTSDQRSD